MILSVQTSMWACESLVKGLNNLSALGTLSNYYAYLGDFCCLELVFF